MTKARYLTIDADGRRVTARLIPVPCRARTEEAHAKRLEAVGCEAHVPGENEVVVTIRAHRRARRQTRKLAIRHKAWAPGYVFADHERAAHARRVVNDRLPEPQLRKPLPGQPLDLDELDAWVAALRETGV